MKISRQLVPGMRLFLSWVCLASDSKLTTVPGGSRPITSNTVSAGLPSGHRLLLTGQHGLRLWRHRLAGCLVGRHLLGVAAYRVGGDTLDLGL